MEQTPRNFALQLGALTALYASIASLVTLLFGVITIALPDAAESYWQRESASESIRFAFASLVIVFPAYLILTRNVNRILRSAESGAYLSLTRWLLYLSLFVGGAILVGDAVAVVYNFLNGELSLRFFLKALTLATVVASAFAYYLADAKGYWQEHEQQSIKCGVVALVVVVMALVLGFYYMESPREIRERRIDTNQINDLQTIQHHIQYYVVSNEQLPDTLEAAFVVGTPPEAPASRADYRYEITDTGFTLCAEFGSASQREDYPYPTRAMMLTGMTEPYIEQFDNWQHEAGDWCFERTVVFPVAE